MYFYSLVSFEVKIAGIPAKAYFKTEKSMIQVKTNGLQ
jgi:hypothetical protein